MLHLQQSYIIPSNLKIHLSVIQSWNNRPISGGSTEDFSLTQSQELKKYKWVTRAISRKFVIYLTTRVFFKQKMVGKN